MASFANRGRPRPGRRGKGAGALRTFTLADAGRADQLTLAYGRYVELHGRALADPRSGCSIARLPERGAQTVIFTFWNRRAADEFDRFWSRYEPIYARAPERQVALRRPDRQGAAAGR